MANNEVWKYQRDPFYWKEKVAKAAKKLMQNIAVHLRDRQYKEFFGKDNQQKINSLVIDVAEALGALRSWTSEVSDRIIVNLLKALDSWWFEYWKGAAGRAQIAASLELLQEYLQPIIISILGIKIEPETKEVNVPQIEKEKPGFWKRVMESALAQIIAGIIVGLVVGVLVGRIF